VVVDAGAEDTNNDEDMLLIGVVEYLSCISRSGVTGTELLVKSLGSDDENDCSPLLNSWCGELRLASDLTKAYSHQNRHHRH